MKSFFLRVLVLIVCTFSFVFFGCDNQPNDPPLEDTPPIKVDAFDQTKEVQKNLGSEAQQVMDALTNAQQVPQVVESLNAQQSKKTARVPDFDGN